MKVYSNDFDLVLFAPPEAALAEAKRVGISGVPFHSRIDFVYRLRPWIAKYDRIVFAATGVAHSLIFIFWNIFYRRQTCHTHMVYGGSNEQDSYGRKKKLNFADIVFIAVSDYVQELLIANGVRSKNLRDRKFSASKLY